MHFSKVALLFLFRIKIKSDKADSEITLLEFYKRKDISIKRPNLPVVIADGRNRRAYAPELLYVLPLQRVPIQSMEQDISDPLGKVSQNFIDWKVVKKGVAFIEP